MPRESLRTFIALDFDENIKGKIFGIQQKFKQTNCLKASWVQQENIHLTLKFLGDTPLKHIDKIKKRIKECLINQNAINCNINCAGVFPNERLARALWAGIDNGKTQIADLAKKLEDSLFLLGFKKEKREFKTHITICRIKQVLDNKQFEDKLYKTNKLFEPLEFSANKIIFFESKLSPQGSTYTSLSTYILK